MASSAPPSNHGPPILDQQSASTTVKEGWYDTTVNDIPLDERTLLEHYSGILPSDVLPHVLRLRDEAFALWPYASIGQMRFLSFNLRRLPFYERIVERLKAGATFCDAGCCFGQELRHLTFVDKIPDTQLYGFDLEAGFIQRGYELFRDKETFKGTLVAGNVLDDGDRNLEKFNNKMDVVFCASFLHVFDWDDMVRACKRLVLLSRPNGMICGKQLGSLKSGSYRMPTASGSHWRHDAESMTRMWEQIGREAGTKWKVEGGLYEGLWELGKNQKHEWSDENQRMLWWVATREET